MSENEPNEKPAQKIQERPVFSDNSVLDTAAGDRRRAAPPEEVERLERDLAKLGDLFEGSNVRWQLDGAINISLMKGELIGAHKDFDLTVDPDDLKRLEQYLSGKGYGLFLSYEHPNDPDNKRAMRQVSAQEFREAPEDHLMLAAIDESGKIRDNESLNYLDVHLICRDENGNPLGWSGVPLPAKWYEPQPIEHQGRQINLSHPAKVAYFKLHDKRAFDRTDLKELASTGRLTEEDLSDLEQVMERTRDIQLRYVELVLNDIAPKLKQGMSFDEVFEVIAAVPSVAQRLERDERTKERVAAIAGAIVATDITPDNISAAIHQATGVNKRHAENQVKLGELRAWVSGKEI